MPVLPAHRYYPIRSWSYQPIMAIEHLNQMKQEGAYMFSIRQNLLSTAALLPVAMVLAAGGVVAAATMAQGPGAQTARANPQAMTKQPQSNAEAVVRVAASCNPCAAKKACNPCNPCAAKKADACNPCAAKKVCNPCNPCAAQKAANPCNPCNPCAANAGLVPTECYVPSLKAAAAGNPCAAQKASNPCNPCAAQKAANPCNPCAAQKAANPCNPCAASVPEVNVPADEMKALYDCLQPKMKTAYRKGDHWAAKKWAGWNLFSTLSYRSETHGGRFVQNAVNAIAATVYGKYEDLKVMPAGSTIAKPSFVVSPDGQASIGPLFIMEKMIKGFNEESADWRYAMIMPDGSTFGITKGLNSAGMGFCVECHAGSKDNDYMMFMPEEYRRK